MSMEEKIYSLMVQAEDIQAHALMLQNGAEKTFAELPLAVGQAVKKIRSTGLLWGLFQVAVALVIIGVVYFAGGLMAKSRVDELAELKIQLSQARATLEELQSKTWGLELMKYNDGTRGIILPKGIQYERNAPIEDGKIAVIIKP